METNMSLRAELQERLEKTEQRLCEVEWERAKLNDIEASMLVLKAELTAALGALTPTKDETNATDPVAWVVENAPHIERMA
jgi:hypothetical protein